MRFVTFQAGGREGLGALCAEKGVLDLEKAALAGGGAMPRDMQALIDGGPSLLAAVTETFKAAQKASNAAWLPLAQVKLMAPIPRPRKNVFCVGRNYREHIIEMARARGREVEFPKVPEFFSKPATTVVGQDDTVERHAKHTNAWDYEVELAVIIGKKVRDLSEADALSAVFGYTVVNDVTARDAQRAHGQFFKGKGFDRSCPMGPCIVTADEYGDPSGHKLSLKVNGEIRQNSNTSDLLFNVPQILASLSAALTLEPGDVVATGTPSGVAQGMTPPKFLNVGDVMEAEVEGIGVLRNRIVD
jgi:2-keto-4-pentenoate hydratase/2-oxohepta-3-ene-1,7-dioic acid hydratase in catechol pathway